MRMFVLTFTLATALTAAVSSLAADAKASAEDILKTAMETGTVGLQQGTATLKMTITNARGEKKNRTLEVKAMRDGDGLLKTLIRFSRPAEVAGISFLVLEKKDSLPDQYVYVPAAKVVRRVAAGNASSSFFGSDFSFVDLMPLPANEMSKAGLKRLPDTKVGGQPAHVISASIDVEGAPYSKLVTYVHKKFMIPIKIEFFDPSGALLKVLKVKKLNKLNGKMVPTVMVMKNVQKKSSTLLEIENPNPKAKLTASDFTEEAMQR